MKWLLYVFVFVCLNSAFGQYDLEFKKYTTKDGLLTDEVYNLYQDKRGYIWTFSRYGTLKYNGRNFEPILKNLPFKEAFIYAIYENSDGRIWIANSNANIYEVRNDSAIQILGFEAVSYRLKNSVSEIVKLFVDENYNIYLTTKGESYKLVKLSKGYRVINLSENLDSECQIIKTLELENEVLQITSRRTENDLDSICKDKRLYVKLPDRMGKSKIQLPTNFLKFGVRVMKKFNEELYFSCLNSIYRVKDSLSEIKQIAVENAMIINYTKDRNGHLWVGCYNSGLYELNEKDSVVRHYFGDVTINDVLVDHENGLWVSTPGLGLFYCRDINSRLFPDIAEAGVSVNFIKKTGDQLFLGNNKGAVFKVKDGVSFQIREADNNPVMDITNYQGGYLLALRYVVERIYQGDKKRVAVSNIREPTYLKLISRNDDTLIKVWRRGIDFSVFGVSKKRLDFSRKIMSAQLVDDKLWFGTDDGVFQFDSFFTSQSRRSGEVLFFDKDTLFRPIPFAGTANTSIVNIVRDMVGNLWFCSLGNGVFKWDGSRLSNYGVGNGLPADIVNSISFSEDNSALLSTNKGLFFSVFDKSLGRYNNWKSLYEGEVQDALFFENKIYLNTSGGLIVLDYRKDRAGYKIFFNLRSVFVNASVYGLANLDLIPSNPNSIEFVFDLITFKRENTPLKYELTGSVADSGYANNSVIKFDRLAPGNYMLLVYPDITLGKDHKIIIPFYIRPAFWQTFIFKALFLLFLLLLISVAFWFVVRYNRRKEEVKAKNEQLILEYKLIALKAQINPHFMSNCLSAIQELVESNNNDKANYYIAEFGLMVRKILEYSSRQVITIEQELELLNLYIELEQLRFDNKFSFQTYVDDDVDIKEVYVPPLLLNPVVENAIWHGLLPMDGKKPGELSVTIKSEDENLVFFIRDNGVGLDQKKKKISNTSGNSFGTKIMEQRLNNINYLYKRKDSKIIYTDLKDHGSATGTLVTIFLPSNLMPEDYGKN
jgi:ligand-binding sensor domain-containing protein